VVLVVVLWRRRISTKLIHFTAKRVFGELFSQSEEFNMQIAEKYLKNSKIKVTI